MSITVDAVYENGTLQLEKPLPFKERERVRVTVESHASSVAQGYGIIGWKGDHQALERLLTEAEEAPKQR